MLFYGVVYNLEGKTPYQWAKEFNALLEKNPSQSVSIVAEARSNCVVLFKKGGSHGIYNLERPVKSGKTKAWRQ